MEHITDEALRAMCIEWYLKHGERAVDLFLCAGSGLLFELKLVSWIDPDNQSCPMGKLTPKALKLTKGNTNETKT